MSRREGIKKFIKDFNDIEPIVEYSVLNIDHLTDSFIIMLIGIILSILVLTIECLCLYFNNKRAGLSNLCVTKNPTHNFTIADAITETGLGAFMGAFASLSKRATPN